MKRTDVERKQMKKYVYYHSCAALAMQHFYWLHYHKNKQLDAEHTEFNRENQPTKHRQWLCYWTEHWKFYIFDFWIFLYISPILFFSTFTEYFHYIVQIPATLSLRRQYHTAFDFDFSKMDVKFRGIQYLNVSHMEIRNKFGVRRSKGKPFRNCQMNKRRMF